MNIDDILSRFEDVSEEADGYLARCPSHGDSRPSLRVWVGDDHKVRLSCRAGCVNGDVVAAAGLRWPDMFNVTGDAVTVPKERPAMVGIGGIAQLRMWLDALPLIAGQTASEYAQERFGISATEAERLGLRSSVTTDDVPRFVSASFARYPRMVVPLNGFDGVARGAQGRDLSGQCPGRWLSLSNLEGQRWAPYGVFRVRLATGSPWSLRGRETALQRLPWGMTRLPFEVLPWRVRPS